MAEQPDKTTFAMDGCNAFNCCNRVLALHEVFKHQKQVIPHLVAMYGTDPKCWFYGLVDGIKPIAVKEGFTQGDVMSTWLYIMSIQPFLIGIRDILGLEGFVRFFVDDGNLFGSFEKIMEAIQYVIDVGPRFGYVMSKLKGSLCLGKCGNWELALARKNQLINTFGLDESIIHIHPDDCELEEQRELAAQSYGMKLVGAYVGTDSYIRHNLAIHLDKLQSTVDKLLKVSHLQCRYLLLRYCFCPKIIHLLRNTRPDLTDGIVEVFEKYKKKIFCDILGKDPEHLEDVHWLQSQLQICDGGMGLGNLEWIRHSAFAASFISHYWVTVGVEGFDMTNVLADLDTVENKHLIAFRESFRFFHQLDPALRWLNL